MDATGVSGYSGQYRTVDFCSDPAYTTEDDCTDARATWTDAVGFCSDLKYTTEDDCTGASATWTDASCSDSRLATESACEDAGWTWTDAFCSVPGHTTESACTAAFEVWTSAGSWSAAAWSAGDDLVAQIDGLYVDTETGTAYEVRVAAVSALGVSDFEYDTATLSLEHRAPGKPRNVQVFPAAGGLLVTWDLPLDLGNPPFEGYEFQIQPTNGWDCATKPTAVEDEFTVWTSNDADTNPDFPLWVAIYCVYGGDGTTNSPFGYYNPPVDANGDSWVKVIYNPSGAAAEEPYGPNAFEIDYLTEGVEYQVRMRAKGSRVPDPANPGEFIELWTDVMRGTPAPRPPSAPRNLSLTARDGTIDAEWQAPQDPGSPEMDGYVFQWRETGTTTWEYTVKLAGPDDPATTTLDMLTNGGEYEVRVAAFHNTVLTGNIVITDNTMITAQSGATVTYLSEAPDDGSLPECLDNPTADCYVLITADITVTYVPTAPADGTACPTNGVPTADCYVLIAVDEDDQGIDVEYVVDAAHAGSLPACPTIPAADCYVVIASSSTGEYATGTATPRAVESPGVPQNLQLRPGDRTIAALWDAPEDLGNPALVGYVIPVAPGRGHSAGYAG